MQDPHPFTQRSITSRHDMLSTRYHEKFKSADAAEFIAKFPMQRISTLANIHPILSILQHLMTAIYPPKSLLSITIDICRILSKTARNSAASPPWGTSGCGAPQKLGP